MKLTSCAALVLCATAVMAKDIYTECTGLLNSSCPKGSRQEWHGPTAKDSGCYCVRPETAAESQARAKKERPGRCTEAISSCKDTWAKYENNERRFNSCENVLRWCERSDIDETCKYLKDEKKKWQCAKSRNYQNILKGKPWTEPSRIRRPRN